MEQNVRDLTNLQSFNQPPLTAGAAFGTRNKRAAQAGKDPNKMPPLSMGARAKQQDNGTIEMQKQKFMQHVKMSFSNARTVNTIDLERNARYYRLFRNRQIQKNYRGLSNLFVPEPYRIVRKKTAKLANAIQNVEVIPETKQDIQAAQAATHLMNYLRNKLQLQAVERAAIQESRITGLAWLKCLWNQDKEKGDKPWMGFDVTMHPMDRVFVAPGTTILDILEGNIKWLIHETYEDLETLAKNPNYSKEDLMLLAQRGGMAQKPTPLSMARIMNENRQMLALSQRIKKIQVLEYWGKWNPKMDDADNDAQEQDLLGVVADQGILLRMEDNPYKELMPDHSIPFIPVVANPIAQELYPVGDIEPAESLFNELNDTRNQRMDTVTLNIDPAKEVLRGANIDEKELISRRGWVIHSNMPNGIRFIPPDMQGVRAAIDEEKIIRSDIQQVSNVIDFTEGAETQAGLSVDTARGAIIAKGEADSVLADEVTLLKMSLKMLYRVLLTYAQVFLDKPFAIRVMENGQQNFLQLDKMSIQGNLDLDVEMKTLQDKTTDQQLKLMLFSQAKTVPGANIGKFFTDVLDSFFEHVNIAEYYQPPQPTPPPPEHPNVSISLKGELTPFEADEIFKTIPGVDSKMADSLLRPEGRDLLRGNHPEVDEKKQKELEMMEKQAGVLKQLNEPEENESDTSE